MLVQSSRDNFSNSIAVALLSEQDMLDLIDCKQIESSFTNAKLFIRLGKSEGLNTRQIDLQVQNL